MGVVLRNGPLSTADQQITDKKMGVVLHFAGGRKCRRGWELHLDHTPEPWTLNLEPCTLHTKPWTLNP